MNIEVKNILPILKSKSQGLIRHGKFIFILVALSMSGFLVFQINRLTSMEPTPEQLTAQQELIKRPKIDQETINKIEQLEDQNIAVQSLFQAARDNPFQD